MCVLFLMCASLLPSPSSPYQDWGGGGQAIRQSGYQFRRMMSGTKTNKLKKTSTGTLEDLGNIGHNKNIL